MIKLRKFWSNHAEDTLLISIVVIGTLGLYLAAAYFIITVLQVTLIPMHLALVVMLRGYQQIRIPGPFMIEYVVIAAIIIALLILIRGAKSRALSVRGASTDLRMHVLVVVCRIRSKSPKLYLASSRDVQLAAPIYSPPLV